MAGTQGMIGYVGRRCVGFLQLSCRPYFATHSYTNTTTTTSNRGGITGHMGELLFLDMLDYGR